MTLEPRRIEISTGLSLQDTKLQNQARSHPFTQQERENLSLDLIFPSNESFENALETSLKAPRYLKGQVSLSKIAAESSSVSFVESGLSLLSAGSGPTFSTQEEDIWCIDHRGVLTLSVCKDTYNTLGLVGKRVAFGKGKAKQGDGRHGVFFFPFFVVVTFLRGDWITDQQPVQYSNLHPVVRQGYESSKVRAHRELALKRWEERRAREVGCRCGMFLSFSEDGEGLETAFENLIEDRPTNPFEAVQVRVCQQSKKGRKKTGMRRWKDYLSGLGMAGLGATRQEDSFCSWLQDTNSEDLNWVTSYGV
ncbi:hypothetical protein BT96DRAFT_987112 [Gymnopus androsaceus JB14]|uniref:Uncharacterized protein n=1 Tax=Gymnopus androsaceus JB14 TaxID=1447944 RepID=A0A6A4ICK9_9AGAR|nr:hypothetical protein BT96DRAFT_987112 [Gymnopus androsaceus JB14]